MVAQLVLQFDNAEDFQRLLQLLKETGFDQNINVNAKPRQKQRDAKRKWAFGIGNLGGKLDHINIRDYAYED